jgi:hypothetical protein
MRISWGHLLSLRRQRAPAASAAIKHNRPNHLCCFIQLLSLNSCHALIDLSDCGACQPGHSCNGAQSRHRSCASRSR